MNSDLLDFVRSALAAGTPRAEIAKVLTEAGWDAREVASALAAFAEIPFPIPVPRPRPYLPAREAYLHLVMFATLYLSLFRLGDLGFSFVDLAYPDAGDMRALIRDAMRWDTATLVVAFPIFLFTFLFIDREIARKPERGGSRPRKWLTYITLFIAAASVVGDLTVLVHGVLNGELTMRFALKSAIVFVLAGGSFGFFLREMRKDAAK